MAVVTPVVPPTRRNVELVLLLLAIAVAGAAYAIVGLAIEGAVPRTSGSCPGASRCSSSSCTACCAGAHRTPTP